MKRSYNRISGVIVSVVLVLSMIFGVSAYAVAPKSVEIRKYYEIKNPYETVNWDTWGHYKANLHTHSNVSDGDDRFDTMIEAYYAAGYDILAMTDHGTVSKGWNVKPDMLWEFKVINNFKDNSKYYLSQARYDQMTSGSDRGGRGMTDIKYGIELNGASASKTHINGFFANQGHGDLGVTQDTYEPAVKAYGAAGGITQLNHIGETRDGSISTYRDASFVKEFTDIFLNYPSCVAMELFNRSDGSTKYDRYLWDSILKVTIPKGRVVFGTANDDAHSTGAINKSWEMFMLPSNTSDNVRTALNNGTYFACSVSSNANSYYNGNGVHPEINRVTVDQQEQTISLDTRNDVVIEWVADGNEVIATGNTIDLDNYQDKVSTYVRAEVKGTGSIMLTQPFAVYPKTEEVEIPDNPEVVPVDNTTTVIDNTDHVIYGLEEGMTDFSKFVKVSGNAQLSITPTENGYGTGTVVDVVSDGNVINSYKVVIFGDVDGDGYSNAYDSIALQLYMSYNVEFSKEKLMSGDINNDGIIDETDIIYSNLAGVFLYTIPQTRT